MKIGILKVLKRMDDDSEVPAGYKRCAICYMRVKHLKTHQRNNTECVNMAKLREAVVQTAIRQIAGW